MSHCDHQSPTGDISEDLRLTRMIHGIGEYGNLQKSRPHLLEYRAKGDMLNVVFRPCGPIRIINSATVDIFTGIRRRDGKQGGIVGFSLWGVSDVLQEYKESSISLEHLIKRFDRYHSSHGRESVFGEYKEELLSLAREHQFVWWIPE